MIIATEKREPEYVAAQGYVKFLWDVLLYRSDTSEKYTPDEEAYGLPGTKTNLEGDKYSTAVIDYVAVELKRTDGFVKFIKGLSDPRHLTIKISTYPIFKKNLKPAIWHGQLQKLPEGLDTFSWDSIKLTFLSLPGAWQDGDDVKDPNTSTYYKNKHVTDTVLPAFLDKGLEQAGHGSYALETPDVSGDTYFWSSYEIPHKKLARTDADFDLSNKTTGICWDTSRSVLYVGVRGAAGQRELPWLVSFDPATRKWTYLTQFKYVGGKTELQRPTEWVVQHLEYSASADKVYFVCQTGHQNLLEKQAHFKCKGEIDLTSIPDTVQLTNANLFTLHDKGISIRSKSIDFDNRGYGGAVPTYDGVDYYADATTGTIGWGTPRHTVKECGPLKITPNTILGFRPVQVIRRGEREFKVYPGAVRIGDIFFIYDKVNGAGKWENLGKIEDIKAKRGYCVIVTQYPTRYDRVFTAIPSARPFVCKPEDVPVDNIFIAEPQEIAVEYLYPKDVGSVESETIYVEARKDKARGDNFFWPQDLGEITEDGKFKIDYVGYVSFASIRSMNEYASTGTEKKYKASESAPFKITLKGYNPSFLIEDGFYTASRLQYHPPAHPCRNQPGPCRVLHNGADCYDNRGKRVESYGNIYLFKKNSTVYAAWNERAEATRGRWFNKCKVGRWNGELFVIVFTDRWGNDYYKAPEIYIKSAIKHKGYFYFGTRYYERNWIDTAMRIFYATKPIINISCRDYDGGLAAVGVVKGDKTDVISAGKIIRLRDTETANPKGKYYFISEVVTGTRYIGVGSGLWAFGSCLAEGESAYLGQVTWFTLLSIDGHTVYDSSSYEAQVAREVTGKYITLAAGRDERHQIRKL